MEDKKGHYMKTEYKQNISLITTTGLLFSFTVALLSVTAISGVLLTSTPASADNDTVIDEVNITVPTACTMTGTGTNSHNAIINLGTSNSAIGETTIKAYCNDSAGFAIYAIGYTDDTDGKNVLTNSTLGSTYDIATGTATSGDTSNWAMKLFTITSPTPTYPITIESDTEGSFASFHTVPDDYALVAKRTEGTDVGTGAEGSTLKSTYQAYISQTQPAGTYTGQVKYTMVHPNTAPAPVTPIYMQDLTSSSIATLLPDTHSTATVYDKRDNQAYTIAKLADGKYWMTENLNIAGGTALSSEDTDFDSSYTLPTTGNWTVSDGKLILPASSTSGFNTSNYAYVYNSNSTTCGDNSPCYSYYSWDVATLGSGRNISTDNANALYSICPKGWRLPSTSNWSFNNTDIGFLLNSYGGNGALDYGPSTNPTGAALYDNIGPGTIPNFQLTGHYESDGFHIIDDGYSWGLYWTSTSFFDRSYARRFTFNPNRIISGVDSNRMSGLPVRCLFKSD